MLRLVTWSFIVRRRWDNRVLGGALSSTATVSPRERAIVGSLHAQRFHNKIYGLSFSAFVFTDCLVSCSEWPIMISGGLVASVLGVWIDLKGEDAFCSMQLNTPAKPDGRDQMVA
jgi:hypothetical protein